MQDIKIPDAHSKKMDFAVTKVEAEGPREPSDRVKVKFSKFVQLVATHDFEDVMKRHAEDDIVLSTNLLADLANAHEEPIEESPKKIPFIFVVGIILGVGLTYLIIKLV